VNVSETEVYTSPLKSKAMVSQHPRRFSRGFTDDRFNTSNSYLENLQMGLPQRSTKFAGTFADLRSDHKKKKFKRRMDFPALRKQKSAESYRKGVGSFSHMSNIYGDEKVHPEEIKGRSYQDLEVRPSPAQVPMVEDLVNRMSTGKKSENIRSKSYQSESKINKFHVKGSALPVVKEKSPPKIRKVRNWTSPKPLGDSNIAIDRNSRPETDAGASRRATRAKPSKKLGFFSIKGDKVKPITKQVVKDIIVSRPSHIRKVSKNLRLRKSDIEIKEKECVPGGNWQIIVPEAMLIQKGSRGSSRRGSSRRVSLIPPKKEVAPTSHIQGLFESMIRGIKDKGFKLAGPSPTFKTRMGIRESQITPDSPVHINSTMGMVGILIHPAPNSQLSPRLPDVPQSVEDFEYNKSLADAEEHERIKKKNFEKYYKDDGGPDGSFYGDGPEVIPEEEESKASDKNDPSVRSDQFLKIPT
jgi:hypothetical protein